MKFFRIDCGLKRKEVRKRPQPKRLKTAKKRTEEEGLSANKIVVVMLFLEWSLWDSNPGPIAYEATALTDWAKAPKKNIKAC